MKRTLLAILSFTLVATACKKSKDAPAFTKENVAGTYKIDKITFKFGSSAEEDITDAWLDECEQDDIVTLNLDLTYSNTDAGVTCGNDYTGTWAIPSTTTFDLDGDIYTVAKWDGSTLGFSQPVDMGGGTGTAIIYYKKQ